MRSFLLPSSCQWRPHAPLNVTLRLNITTHASSDKPYNLNSYERKRKSLISKESISELCEALEASAVSPSLTRVIQQDLIQVIDKGKNVKLSLGQLGTILSAITRHLPSSSLHDQALIQRVLSRLQSMLDVNPAEATSKSICIIVEGLSRLIKLTPSDKMMIDLMALCLNRSVTHSLTLEQCGDLALSCAEARLLPSSSFISLLIVTSSEHLSSLVSSGLQVSQRQLTSSCNILWAIAVLNPLISQSDLVVLVRFSGLVTSLSLSSPSLFTSIISSRLLYALGILSVCHPQEDQGFISPLICLDLLMKRDPNSNYSASLAAQGLLAASAATGYLANDTGIRQFLSQSGSEPQIYESVLSGCLTSWRVLARESKPSGTQIECFHTLQSLLTELDHKQAPYEPRIEALVGGGMFSVDILTPWLGQDGRWITLAIEIDGPSHFVTNNMKHSLGPGVSRIACIESLGIKTLSIPCYEWDALNGEGEKKSHLCSKVCKWGLGV